MYIAPVADMKNIWHSRLEYRPGLRLASCKRRCGPGRATLFLLPLDLTLLHHSFTKSMPTQIALPQDIIDCFIHSLYLCIHSTSDLRAVSLVSHAWLEPAQRCLFSHIIVYSDNKSIQHPSHLYHLRLALLASRPDLAKFVRSVDCLSAAYKADELPLLNTLLATFPNVIAFKLLSHSGTARDALLIPLPGWSQLRHISINALSPRSETEFKPLPRPQTLTAVNICSINLVTWDNILMADMLRHLAQTSARDTLGVARLAYMEQPRWDDQEYAWVPVFAVSIREANSFQNLKSLELQIMPNIGRWAADISGPSRTRMFLISHAHK
jgi:hypothetical protein